MLLRRMERGGITVLCIFLGLAYRLLNKGDK